jgi:hypothetical protein
MQPVTGGMVRGGDVTLEPPPVKGEEPKSPTANVGFHMPYFNCNAMLHVCHHAMPSGCHHAIPQSEFPKIDGSNPKLWIKQAETYFDLYTIPPDNWVKLATINFKDTAAF